MKVGEGSQQYLLCGQIRNLALVHKAGGRGLPSPSMLPSQATYLVALGSSTGARVLCLPPPQTWKCKWWVRVCSVLLYSNLLSSSL